MKLHFLGGASEVGASCTLVEIEDRRILVDAGIRMGAPPGRELPNLALLDEVGLPEEVLLTHAHTDHTGALPALVPDLPWSIALRCTPPTRAIAAALFQDALKIMKLRSEREDELPLYSREAVKLTLGRMKAIPYLAGVPICGGALRATWIPSGHILGAASIYIEGERETLLMSGDVSMAHQRTIPGMMVPECKPEVMVLESTYGNRRHADRAQQEAALAARVAEVVEKGGKVLIPAFAVGRAQEVILILAQAMRRKEIPVFPVFVDGMVRVVNGVYTAFPESLSPPLRRRVEKGENPFYTDFIKVVGAFEERRRVLEGAPCCIVASSGMLSGGASSFYARELVGAAENLIALTGYQDEESPGRALLDLARAEADSERFIRLQGLRVPVACRVETYSLSAHADAGELRALVQRLGPRAVYLVHGDAAARAALGTHLDVLLPEGVFLPDNGGSCTPASGWGGKAKRRYGSGALRQGLGGGRPIDGEALEEIGRYLAETDHKGLLRVQDLAEIWCGTESTSLDEVKAFKKVLDGGQRVFKADRKRPYLFHLGGRGAGAEEASPGRMEMNEVRERIQRLFPPESGLFRFGVHQEEGAYELAFHFPDLIRTRYAGQLEALEAETGWTLRVRPTPHQERLFEEALAVLPEGVAVAKAPALHLDRREVRLEVEVGAEVLPRWEMLSAAAAASFAATTGYALVLGRGPGAASGEQSPEGALEINQAFAHLRQAFAGQAHAPSKLSLKSSGDPCIELAFISPQVGARYEPLLQRLGERIGWPLRIRQAANQKQIADEARRITPAACRLCGEPRIFVAEASVVVPVVSLPPEAERAALEASFREATGFHLCWSVAG